MTDHDATTSGSDSARFDDIDRLLADRGHDLAFGRVRIAAGRSGVAVGFPEKPQIHVSWLALLGVAVFVGLRRRRWHRRA